MQKIKIRRVTSTGSTYCITEIKSTSGFNTGELADSHFNLLNRTLRSGFKTLLQINNSIFVSEKLMLNILD